MQPRELDPSQSDTCTWSDLDAVVAANPGRIYVQLHRNDIAGGLVGQPAVSKTFMYRSVWALGDRRHWWQFWLRRDRLLRVEQQTRG